MRGLFRSIGAVHLILRFGVAAGDCATRDWQKRNKESIGRRYQSIPKYWSDVVVRHRASLYPNGPRSICW